MTLADLFDDSDSERVRPGNRISLLPISRFCPKAARLSEEHGAGRAAAMSSAFHSKAAGQPDWPKLWASLDEQERATVDAWPVPEDVDIGGGVVLAYKDAAKEVEVDLELCGVRSLGHIDMGWVVQGNAGRVAYVGDMKKTEWTTLDGPTSLQLIGYGLAFAKKNGCDHYGTGIWIIESREWRWHTRLFAVDGPEAADVAAAMANTDGEARPGGHCRDCWGRFHCNEHLLPAALSVTALAPLTEPGGINRDNALNVLLQFQALRDLVGDESPVKSALYEYARRHGGIGDPATGKVWAPVQMPGKESVDVKALRRGLGRDAEDYIKRGNGFAQMRWVRP